MSFLYLLSNGSPPTSSYSLLLKSFPCRRAIQRVEEVNELLFVHMYVCFDLPL